MSITRICVSGHVSSVADVAASELESRSELLTRFAGVLLRMGFERVRYYEVVPDAAGPTDVAVLTASFPAGQDLARTGYQVPFGEWTITQKANPGGKYLPATGCSVDYASKQAPNWFRDLKLDGRAWVDIPLSVGTSLLGIVACDWMGTPDALGGSDQNALSLAGVAIGARLDQIDAAISEKAALALSSALRAALPSKDLLDSAIREVTIATGAAIGALFEYRWTTDSLVKTAEYSTVHRINDLFPETFAAGQYLTGLAWQDERYRYISDFPSFHAHSGPAESNACVERHARLLGRMKSLLYARLGRDESSYLIRLINRADNPDLPFLGHKRILSRLMPEVSEVIAQRTVGDRLERLQHIARQAADPRSETDDILQRICDDLRAEHIDDAVFLFHSADGDRFTVHKRLGRGFVPSDRTARLWTSEPIYTSAVTKRQVSVHPVASAPHKDHLLFWPGSDYTAALAVPFSTPRTVGALVVPIAGAARRRNSLTKSFTSIIRTLEAYTAVAGNTVDAETSRLTVEAAERLVGHIGHELQTPFAVLGDVAVAAVMEAKRAVQLMPALVAGSEVNRKLEEAMQIIDARRSDLYQTLELALTVGQASSGTIQLHLRHHSILETLNSAVEGQGATPTRNPLVYELSTIDLLERRLEYVLEYSESARRLGSAIYDANLLRIVLSNVLRNALKYSLPRHKGEPMVIRILAQPQATMAILQFENWGFGIPEAEHENVFRPFVRGSLSDKMKVIRGMGLGLFLSRRIMSAHGGDILLRHSYPTLDDRLKLDRHEGYLTLFEVRLPLHLKVGVARHGNEGLVYESH